MKSFAAIDIGSNSVQFLIADSDGKQLFREQYVTGLGRGVAKDSNFDQASMDETFEALEKCLEECKNNSVKWSNIIATATEASRKAENAQAFYSKVKTDLNLDVRIISGEEEAYLSTYGLVKFGASSPESLVVDIGGASTEVTRFTRSPFSIDQSISLPLGSVKLKHLKEEGQVSATEFLSEYCLNDYQSKSFIGISGTMTSLTAISLNLKVFDEDKVDNVSLSKNEINEIASKLKLMSLKEISTEFPFLGKRAPLVTYGCEIMLAIMDGLGASRVVTSTKGLVHGSIAKLKDDHATIN